MVSQQPVFNQLNLIVKDMAATLAFYRKLGLVIEAEDSDYHVTLKLPNGFMVDFDTTDFVKKWNSHWKNTGNSGVVLNFFLSSREAVDQLYDSMRAAGYPGQQRPFDGFWGARYAVIEDPDGNGVGLMSPRDVQHKSWPPELPPSEV